VILLALDTSDIRGSVALLQDEQVLQAIAHDTTEDYSSWVLPTVDRLLAANQLKMRDVDVYAASSGPGSFTGLRIGLTSVKAWSEVYGGKIAAVSRLEAIATQAAGESPFVAAFVDAQRGQVFGGLFQREGGVLQRVDEELVIAPEEFLPWVTERAVNERTAKVPPISPVVAQHAAPERSNHTNEPVAVEWISLDPHKLTDLPSWNERAKRGERIQQSSDVLAPWIGKLGLQRAREGRWTDALSLDAQYVRRSDAEIFWKGHAAR
jgi:tRNA threonylcarbamoyl adenosine modification protein YeaZ